MIGKSLCRLMRLRASICGAIAAAALATAPAARAELIQFSFTGIVDSISNDSPIASPISSLTIGSSLSGRFSVDTSALGIGSSSGLVLYDLGIPSFTFDGFGTFANTITDLGTYSLAIGNDVLDGGLGANVDSVEAHLFASGPNGDGNIRNHSGSILLRSTDTATFLSSQIPADLEVSSFDRLNIFDFLVEVLDLDSQSLGVHFITGSLTSIARIPEPAALTLLGPALMGLRLLRRRRST